MIAFIKGNIEYISKDRLVIEANSIGYNVFMPASQLDTLRVDEEIKIFTYLSVREDAMQLYGFINNDDLEVFKLLLTVSGIGPKGALAILSTMTTDDLRMAVLSDDSKSISKAPGVGGKTAQRVIIELKDKLNIESVLTKNEENAIFNQNSNQQSEAVMALVSLGYSQSDAYKVVNSLEDTEKMDVESIIKIALRKLY